MIISGIKKFFCLFLLFASTLAFAIDAKAMVVSGKVQIQESNPWVDLKEGDAIKAGSIISTGFNSTAIIKLGDSVCRISPLTRMSIEQLSNRDIENSDKNLTKTIIFIDTGKASFIVNSTKKNLNDFKVHTPASTASVRGTAFDTYADGEVSVSQGLVGVSGETEITDDEFISDGKELTGFSQTKDVGGGLIPVFAGQRIYVDKDNAWISINPIDQRTYEYYSLVGDSERESTKEIIVNEAGSVESTTNYTNVNITVSK